MVKRNSGTSKEDICQNQFTAYVVLAVKRKRQAYIKKKIRDKENQAKREEEQSNFGAEENTVWDRLEVQNEELVAAVQQLKPKARFIVTGYVLKGKTFKELAQETKLTERAAAFTYYTSHEKLRIKMEKETGHLLSCYLRPKEEANLHSRNCLADTKIFCGNTL